MMSLAKLTYNNELWTTYQLSEIRNIAAGLSLSDLKNNLTLELILSIEASAFEFMNKQFIEEFYYSHIKEIKYNHELVSSDKIENLILENIKKTIHAG